MANAPQPRAEPKPAAKAKPYWVDQAPDWRQTATDPSRRIWGRRYFDGANYRVHPEPVDLPQSQPQPVPAPVYTVPLTYPLGLPSSCGPGGCR